MTKFCNKCKTEKPVEDFYKNKNRADGLQTCCISCSKSYWGVRDTTKIREYYKKYYQENKEFVNENNKKWRNNNKDKVRILDYNFRKRHPEYAPAKEAKRRASKLKATPVWANLEDIKNVYLEAQYFGYHVDHIIPLRGKNVCGLHVWENLQLLPPSENCRKSNKYEVI